MTPLFLDLTAKRVVIFGGGEIAVRKARFFLPDADVWVVSRSFSKSMDKLAVKRKAIDVRLLPDSQLEDILSDAAICVAALSDRKQNDRIGNICRSIGILFNNASGEKGDLIIPSAIRRAHFVLAVSTDGKSPAVSRFIRKHLEKAFPNLDKMIALQELLRQQLKEIEPSQKRRKDILWGVLNDPAVWYLLGYSFREAKEEAMRRYLHD